MKHPEVVAAAIPTIGPAFVTLFGENVQVLSLVFSVFGLVLARVIAPPTLRQLRIVQEIALTALLMIIMFLIVAGQFTGTPMKPGPAVIWGIGLGFSGLAIVEFFADRVKKMFHILFGMKDGE